MIRFLFILLVLVGNARAAVVQTVRSVDTVAELLALNPRSLSRDGQATVWVSGISRTNEFPLRAIVYDATSGATTNGAAFGSTNWSGRWYFPDRLETTQRLEWWGGIPGSTGCERALTNAAAHVAALGGGYVEAGAGTFHFSVGGINMPSGVRLRGNGPNATIFNFSSSTPAYDYEHVIRWIGDLSNGVGIVSDTASGGKTIILDSVTDWAVGDQLQIRQTNYFSFGGRKNYSAGEFNFIASITGGTNITLLERLEAAYPTVLTRVAKVVASVGSVEGIHFALGVKSGGVTLDYCDGRSYMQNCSGAGTEESHFNVRRSYGITVSDLFVDWDSDPVVGLNYGLIVGDSEYINVRNCFLRSGRAGFDAGGSTIPTRYLTVSGTTMGSTRTNSHGAGLHEDVVNTTFTDCTLLSGVSLGGGKNRLLNSTVRNNTDRAAVAIPAGRYFDWEIRGNDIESTVDPTLGIVYGMRLYLQAGSEGANPESTNYWPGTF